MCPWLQPEQLLSMCPWLQPEQLFNMCPWLQPEQLLRVCPRLQSEQFLNLSLAKTWTLFRVCPLLQSEQLLSMCPWLQPEQFLNVSLTTTRAVTQHVSMATTWSYSSCAHGCISNFASYCTIALLLTHIIKQCESMERQKHWAGRPAVYQTFSTNHRSYTKTLVPIYYLGPQLFWDGAAIFWEKMAFLPQNK